MSAITTIIPAYAGCEVENADDGGERFAIIAWQITQNGDAVSVFPISVRGLERSAPDDIDGSAGVYINGDLQ